MELFMFFIEIIIGVSSVLILFNTGIYIGKRYGNFELFILDVLNKVQQNLKE